MNKFKNSSLQETSKGIQTFYRTIGIVVLSCTLILGLLVGFIKIIN